MKFDSFPPIKASDLEPYFTAKTLGKAREIVQDEMIKLLEKSSTHISARVQGSEPRPYSVIVRANGDYDCSCPSEVQPCKHVAAALFPGKAALEGMNGGERKHYHEGARWAEEYRKLEDVDAFKTWLSGLLSAKENLRRSALQDEFKKLKVYLV